MARRQTIPLADVRAPTAVDDQMSQAEVQASAGQVGNAQDLISIIASQLRLAQGSSGWLQPPTPAQVGTGTIDLRQSLVSCEVLGGVRNGANVIFTTARYFLAPTLTVQFNGSILTPGSDADYLALESQGPGTGFDTIKFTNALPPLDSDKVTASYVRAA